jgi:hypothetical protein
MQRSGGVSNGGRFRSGWAFALLFLVVISATAGQAQAIWAEGGTSTMMRASGFQVNYRWSPVQGWLGAGWSDRFTVGGFLQTRIHHMDVGVGDRYQPLLLDTDVFDQSRYFAGRGVFLQKNDESRTLSVFAGSTAAEQSSNFYRTFTAEQPTGGVFLEQKISNDWSLHSINLVQDRVTSIQSFRYRPAEGMDFGAAGGVGNGSGFMSFSGQLQRQRWQLTTSYSEVGSTFERVSGVTTNTPERVGLNVRWQYQPMRKLQFNAAHENLLSPTLIQDQLPQRVSLDSVSMATMLKGFHLGGGLSTSSSGVLHATTESASVSRNVSSNITASGSLLRIDNQYQTTNILIGSVQERISPRLMLNQGISSQSNNKNFTWGARWISNRFTIGVQQDMLYTPLAGGFNGTPYTSMWSVNLVTQLPRAMRLHTDSFVDPSGKVRYTAWIDGIGLSRGSEQIPHAVRASANFARFVVTGTVQDTDGQPVFGMAVQVDGQVAFTDNTGRFLLRFRKGLTYPLAVLPDRSLSPQYYEVVQAPVSVLAETNDIAHPVIIVVRRAAIPKRQRSDATGSESVTGALPAQGK